MYIIWDKEAAESMKNSHTLLELETFMVKGSPVKTWCAVPPEKIGLDGFATLDRYKKLHESFVDAYNGQDYKLAQDISKYLVGHWGGELDSFYEEILKRISNMPT
jgi:hypothetical protein